jgi:hypothetical protein
MTFKNQSEMFKWIWANRPHTSEVSGKLLLPENHPMWHWQFAHVLSKGAYPSYKLNPDNIMLMTVEEHEKQESFEKFQQRKQELKEQYYKEKRI